MNGNNFALNRLFTKQVINDLVKHNSNEIYEAIIKQYLRDYNNCTNREILNKIYKYMSKYYRNEYFYQNTLLNKLLLGRHSIKTTTAITQIPIERSKADFVLINGKAIVYEIKTELDTFERLQTQLNDYYKAFNHVCVVTCESNYERLLSILEDTKVGICILSKYNTLQMKKEAETNDENINHKTLFKILRKYEMENILMKHFNELPKATPVFYYDACYKLFESIPLENAYKLFLLELKKRNEVMCDNEFLNVPYELKSIMYFSDFSYKQYEKLNKFLNTQYKEVNRCISRI